jgi:hypothetical protein
MASYSYLFRIIRNLYRFKQTEQSLTKIFTLQEETNTSSNTEVKNGGYEIGGYVYDSTIPTFSQSDFLRIVSTRMAICKQSNQIIFEQLFQNVTTILLEFYHEVIGNDADFLLVMIPEEYQIDEQLFKDATEYNMTVPTDYDIFLPQRRLREFCIQHNIPYIDMLPEFKSRSVHQKLYRLRDTHWNIEGNALAVELLMEKFLRDYNWLIITVQGFSHPVMCGVRLPRVNDFISIWLK